MEGSYASGDEPSLQRSFKSRPVADFLAQRPGRKVILKTSYIDISPPISERLGVFPGDVPFSRDISLAFEKGHHLALSAIRTTLHLGAHADAPAHYRADGQGIAERDLSLYMGRALVVHACCPRGHRVARHHLTELSLSWLDRTIVQHKHCPRFLIRTDSFPNADQWNDDFCSIEPAFIDELAQMGVRLVGIDTPSIDPQNSKALESHAVVARNDMAILEGLDLSLVSEGLYTLIAMPLRLEGADASPVRAVLLRDPELLAGLEGSSSSSS